MAATKRMIEYARAISEELGYREPDYSDYEETSYFINDLAPLYKKQVANKRLLNDLKGLYGETEYEGKLSNEFMQLLFDCNEQCGIYMFWYEDKVLYIGKSVNLGDRIYSSFKERIKAHIIDSVSVIKLNTRADCHILEPLLITEHKPILNREFICEDRSELFISNIDINEFERIKVFID